MGTEFGEVVRSDERGAGELQIILDLHGRDAEYCDRGGESMRAIAIESERRIGHLAGGGAGRPALQPDDARGIAHRQRLQSDYIEKTESRNINAYTDGENEHGQQGESGSAGENANAVAHILDEAIEPCPSPGFAGLLSHAQSVAKVVAASASGHLAMKIHVGFEFSVETATIE